MDIPARRQLANVTRSATGELPAQSIQWWVVQLAAEVVDPDDWSYYLADDVEED